MLQQSAEKSIKSLLKFKKIQFSRTHSLEKLIELAKKNGINDLKEFENLSDELDDFAVDGRYDKIATIADDLDECTKKVRKLFITVKKYIKNKNMLHRSDTQINTNL